MERHVEQCSSCQHHLAVLEAEFPDVLTRLRDVFCANGFVGEPMLELLIDELKGFDDGQRKEQHVSAPACDPNAPHARVLGDFRLIREIGRGGMGVVYEAEQMSLGRRVALKTLPMAGLLNERQLQRFKNEAHAAALLHHPHIVPVHSIGIDRGVHFYAMQYVDGFNLGVLLEALRRESPKYAAARHLARPQPVLLDASGGDSISLGDTTPYSRDADRADKVSHRPTIQPVAGNKPTLSTDSFGQFITDRQTKQVDYFRRVAKLVAEAAGALGFAHDQGVVHRDVKPTNLMVDVRGRLWVTDFGLARLDTDATLTVSGDVVGTLRYMSPEQAAGKRGLVDHRTDIYSLGVTLYELLALEPPFSDEDRKTILPRIASEEPVPVRQLNSRIPIDLETIVLKAMAKEPSERYATAVEMADDLQRFLDQRPILASRPTAFERALKWVRRHRASAVTLLSLGGVFSIVTASLTILLLLQNERLASVAREARETSYAATMGRAFDALEQKDPAQAKLTLDRLRADPENHELRGFEWNYLSRELAGTDASVPLSEEPLYTIRVSPDARHMAVAGAAGVVHLVTVPGFEQMAVIDTGQIEVNGVAFSPDGSKLASAGDDGSIRIWDLATRKQILSFPAHPELATMVEFINGGAELITTGNEPSVRMWNAETGESTGVFLENQPERILAAALSHDGRYFAAGDYERNICIFDLEHRKLVRTIRFPDGHARLAVLAFSHDGHWLASGDREGRISIGAVSRHTHQTIGMYFDAITALSFSSDDRRLVAADRSGAVRVFDCSGLDDDARQQAVDLVLTDNWRLEHAGRLDWCGFSSDGTLAGVVRGRTLTSRDTKTGTVTDFDLGQDDGITSDRSRAKQLGAFSPDGKLFLYANDLYRRSPASQGGWEHFKRIAMPSSDVFSTVFLPDSETLVAVGTGGSLYVIDADSGVANLIFQQPFQDVPLSTHALAVSPDGRWAACASHDGQINVFDLKTYSGMTRCEKHGGDVLDLDFAPGGLQFASAGEGVHDVRIWDTTSGRLVRKMHTHGDERPIDAISYSPDGKWLAAATNGDGGVIRIWDLATDHELWYADVGADVIQFSEDGKRLLGAGYMTGYLCAWDILSQPQGSTGVSGRLAEAADLSVADSAIEGWLAHQGRCYDVAFIEQGNQGRLVTVGDDGMLNAWSNHDRTATQILISRDWQRRDPADVAVDGGSDRVALALNDGLRVYESDGSQMRLRWRVDGPDCRSVAFDPLSGQIATGHADGKMRIWQVDETKPVLEWQATPGRLISQVRILGFDDKSLVVVGQSDQPARIYGSTGKVLHEFRESMMNNDWECSGTLFAYAAETEVVVWDAQAERERCRLPGHIGGVHGLAFSPTEPWLAIACGDRSIVLWDLETGQMRARFVGQRDVSASVAFSPDGRTLAGTSEGRGVSLWHVATGLIMGYVGPADQDHVAFTRNGKHLICLKVGRSFFSLNASRR